MCDMTQSINRIVYRKFLQQSTGTALLLILSKWYIDHLLSEDLNGTQGRTEENFLTGHQAGRQWKIQKISCRWNRVTKRLKDGVLGWKLWGCPKPKKTNNHLRAIVLGRVVINFFKNLITWFANFIFRKDLITQIVTNQYFFSNPIVVFFYCFSTNFVSKIRISQWSYFANFPHSQK